MQVDTEDRVVKVKDMAAIACGIPATQQSLQANGRALADGATIAGCGISDGDMIVVMPQQAQPAADALALESDGSAQRPQAYIDVLRNNPNAMSQLARQEPLVAKAVTNGSIEELQLALKQVRRCF